MWRQYELSIQAPRRGLHLITHEVVQSLADLPGVRIGWVQLFLLHTSAALTINENADPDVQADLEESLNRLAPEGLPYKHSMEGLDDMPAHVKSSLFGCSLLIPVQNGHLTLGVWQGIYLCEHRNRPTPRKLLLTLHGTSSTP